MNGPARWLVLAVVVAAPLLVFRERVFSVAHVLPELSHEAGLVTLFALAVWVVVGSALNLAFSW